MNGNNGSQMYWTGWHTWAMLAILVAIGAIGLQAPNRMWAWVGVLVLLFFSIVVAGHGRNRLWSGAFIDERNKVSLSRLQILCWTALVLSAFLTAGLGNVTVYLTAENILASESSDQSMTFNDALAKAAGVAKVEDLGLTTDTSDDSTTDLLNDLANALAIAVPQELWLLMGISITSLLGTPLIRRNHTQNNSVDKDEEDTMIQVQAHRQGIDKEYVGMQGHVMVNKRPQDARFGDMFERENVGNANQLDLGKLQNFYFTVILLLVYGVLLGVTFNSVKLVTQLPTLSASMLALLGISHAGYLASKAIPNNVRAGVTNYNDMPPPSGSPPNGGGAKPKTQPTPTLTPKPSTPETKSEADPK